MSLTESSICDLDWEASEFSLLGVDNKIYSLSSIAGSNATLGTGGGGGGKSAGKDKGKHQKSGGGGGDVKGGKDSKGNFVKGGGKTRGPGGGKGYSNTGCRICGDQGHWGNECPHRAEYQAAMSALQSQFMSGGGASSSSSAVVPPPRPPPQSR